MEHEENYFTCQVDKLQTMKNSVRILQEIISISAVRMSTLSIESILKIVVLPYRTSGELVKRSFTLSFVRERLTKGVEVTSRISLLACIVSLCSVNWPMPIFQCRKLRKMVCLMITLFTFIPRGSVEYGVEQQLRLRYSISLPQHH